MTTRSDKAAEWEPYKAEIKQLYLIENKTKAEVIAFMKTERDFHKSPTQYQRQFEKWGFVKYSNAQEYEYMGYAIKKRKFANKDTEIDIRGKRLKSRELGKELRRHLPKDFALRPLTEHGPPTPEGIQVLTPPARTDEYHIELNSLPFFQFNQFLRDTILSTGLPLSCHLDFMTIAPAAMDISRGNNDSPFPVLEAVMIGQTEQELCSSSEAIIRGPPTDAIFYTISYCAYLSSNNLLPDENLDRIVRCLVANDQNLPLFNFLKPDCPTVSIFMRQLLSSAARLRHSQLMRFLLRLCLASDDPGSIFRSYELAYTAYKYNEVELLSHILDAGVRSEEFLYDVDFFNADPHSEIVKLLLTKGSLADDINSVTYQYLLESAVGDYRTETVKLLVDSRVNNIEVDDGTFFHSLALGGEIAQLLVCSAKNVNIVFDLSNETDLEFMCPETCTFLYPIQSPLEVAALHANWDLVKCLVDNNAKIDPDYHVDIDRYVKWISALEGDYYKLDELPFAFPPISSALQAAVLHGNTDMTTFLLQKGAKVDGRPGGCCRGYTPLQLAVATGNKDLVNLLLDWEADVNAPAGDYIGSTALQVAARSQDTGIFEVLLARGANLHQQISRAGMTALQNACTAGNIELVQLILNHRCVDVNEPPSGEGGRTALQAASASCASSSLDIMKLLLANGADCYAPPTRKRGITALQGAASQGNVAKAKLLLDRGSQIEVCSDQYGTTALHLAIENGHFQMVDFLLREGATPYYGASTTTKRNPLQEACWNGDTRIASLLLSRVSGSFYVDIPAAFKDGVTALQAAVQSDNLELITLLLDSGANPNAPGAMVNGKTALERAILAYNFKATRILLARGARFKSDYNIRPPYFYGCVCRGGSANRGEFISLVAGGEFDMSIFPPVFLECALTIAIRAGKFDVIELILSSGALSTRRAKTGDHPSLEEAAWIGCVKSMNLLIEHGVGVNERVGHAKNTALQIAVDRGHVKAVKYLLEHGADVGASTRGLTVLGAAARTGNIEIVRYLVKHGANVGDSTHTRTVLQVAAETGNIEFVRYLVEHGADVGGSNCGLTVLLAAVKTGNIEFVRYLVEHGADVEGSNCGLTVLLAAAKTGNIEIVRYLVELGCADVNAPAHGCRWFGRTALQYAVEYRHVEVTRYLLERGADVNAPPAPLGGVTALQAAAINGAAGIVLILLEANADVTAPSAPKQGRTAIEGAAEHGRLDILHMLLQIHPPGQSLADQLKRAEELAQDNDHYEISRIIRGHRESRGCFTVRVHNCGHYRKTLKQPCEDAKRVKSLCRSDNTEDSSTTGTPHCGIAGCDKKSSLKREGPGARTDGGFDEDDADWDD
ncbi:hypothetical protein FQN53_005744 [Emmonsiellopsis sp. PD_33]|nr:hypothetical protein FQN53_005744 [Emmonsiellopsis sp. PD_33]